MMRGHLDVFTRERIEGWAWDAGASNDLVAPRVYANGVVIAANDNRNDGG
jgi:hypothetical protein